MDTYIIYSGGERGYGLYEASPSFPEAYRESVAALYERQHIVSASTTQFAGYCCRFAPLQDLYVLSVIFKDCTCAAENRTFFATVNWLFTAQEAEQMLGDDTHVAFFEYICRSDAILEEAGYVFKRRLAPVVKGDAPTENEQKALVSAAYYATKAACEDDGQLSAQVFVGCADEKALFRNLLWVLRTCPRRLRRHFSFYVGATAVSETFGVALAVFHDPYLQTIVSTGDYSGSMAVKKMTLFRGEFTSLMSPPSAADAYVQMSDADKQRMNVLFGNTDRAGSYWRYILAAGKRDTAAIQGAALVSLLGQQAFSELLEKDVFSEKELAAMYAERQKLTAMPAVVAALSERFAVPDDRQTTHEEKDRNKDKKDKNKDDKDKDKRKEKSDKDKKEKYDQKDKKRENKKDRYEEYDDCKRKKKRSDFDGTCTYDETDDGDDDKHKKQKHARPPLMVQLWKKRAVVARLLWLVVCPVVCLLVAVGIGWGMYYLGVTYIVRLPVFRARLLYGVQLGVTVLLAMPLGHLLVSGVKRLFSRKEEKSQ